MKIFVKTLKGTQFEIEVKPEDMVADVKKNIENVQGSDVYPATQQMLIHQGKVLKDATTLDENKVVENSFIVIMLAKAQSASPPAPASTAVHAPTTTVTPAQATPTPSAPPHASAESDVYGQAASNLVAGSNLEATIQHILDMGGGSWDRNTVIRSLRAAYNNPERAVEYLYSGIPEQAEAPPVARAPSVGQGGQAANPPAQAPQATIPSSLPNTSPLDLFPQGLSNIGSDAGAGNLDFLRDSQQFQALRAMVQANPQILQPMLQELAKQNPHLVRVIQEHQADFLRLINEPIEGDENLFSQLASAMPQAVTVTPEEREAVERLEAMGFRRAMVLQVFFACNKDEELAANYLLDHMDELENEEDEMS
ncbi:hypothetical protein Nepgr_032446 [Nepenthes gracilis]|uniref:Ubiquitin receptor RAD23 n=1 Tax=Nepenthes gracilis TaxID=150966 RepID=A0AAD3TIL8_NEPGR|nr:hypothetical protein Nepgr_032446 [Nepenthes gracilis]